MANAAISRYAAQAQRMRRDGAIPLALTYDALAQQQREQIGRTLSRAPMGAASPYPIAMEGVLDDEDTDTVAAELLDPYRIFAVAVRNGERAFAFWSYAAAHAPSAEVREEAEYLAGQELVRVSWLRRKRRSSYHALRTEKDGRRAGLEALENRLASLLEDWGVGGDDTARQQELRAFSDQARERARQIASKPFDPALPSLRHPSALPEAVWNGLRPLCEALLDRYLQIAGEARDEGEGGRAQAFAAELIACLRLLRSP